MALQIEDGRGTGYVCGVSDVNRMEVSSKSNNRAYYISRDNGEMYAFISDIAPASGNTIFYLKNENTTKNLFIDKIQFNTSGNSVLEIYKATGTPTGTVSSGVNLNLSSNNVASASCFGNGSVAGLTLSEQFNTIRLASYDEYEHDFGKGLILGLNDAIAVTTQTGNPTSIIAEAYFENR